MHEMPNPVPSPVPLSLPPVDAGKTALAATLAMRSEFPLIKMISPETMVGYSEYAKVAKINKVGLC
jgi:vesicle-fusing ATPase